MCTWNAWTAKSCYKKVKRLLRYCSKDSKKTFDWNQQMLSSVVWKCANACTKKRRGKVDLQGGSKKRWGWNTADSDECQFR